MEHVAIDLGGRESQVCVRRADGTIIEEKKVLTRHLPRLLAARPPSRVILETCAEAFGIADAAREANHEVRVVPTTLVKQLGVGARGMKTDRRDAQVLSEVSTRIDLPSVHVPSEMARELKSLAGARELLISTRTSFINNVRGWLRTQLWRVRTGSPSTFSDRVRAHATTASPLPAHVERQLALLDALQPQIKAADQHLAQFAKSHPVCQRLMTIPGVGPVTAVRFLAAIDDPTRFSSAHRVQSYLGLTPGEHSSSDRERRTGITKAGPSALRKTLVQASWSMIRSQPNDPMVRWAMQIALRRGRFVAVVALARKLVGILFAMWRDGTSYRPSRSAAPEHSTPT